MLAPMKVLGPRLWVGRGEELALKLDGNTVRETGPTDRMRR
jgi:hypothetical protein